MSTVAVIDRIGRTHITPYPDVVKEICFEKWMLEADRDPAVVECLMAEDPTWREVAGWPVDGPSPKRWAIGKWARDEDWPAKARDRLREFAPHSVSEAALELANMLPKAMRRLAWFSENGSDKLALDATKFIVATGIGQSLSEHFKPAVVKGLVNSRELTTIEQIRAAELAALAETNQ